MGCRGPGFYPGLKGHERRKEIRFGGVHHLVACQGNENQKDVLLQSPLYHRNLSGLFKLKPQSLRQVLFCLVHHYVGKLRLGPDVCFSGVSVPINCQAWLTVLPLARLEFLSLLHFPFPPATSNFFQVGSVLPRIVSFPHPGDFNKPSWTPRSVAFVWFPSNI